MEVRIFWQDKCPNCPSAKDLGKALEQQSINVGYYDIKDIDGLTSATMCGVMSTPSIAICEGDNVIMSWKGKVPSMDEVKKHLER